MRVGVVRGGLGGALEGTLATGGNSCGNGNTEAGRISRGAVMGGERKGSSAAAGGCVE